MEKDEKGNHDLIKMEKALGHHILLFKFLATMAMSCSTGFLSQMREEDEKISPVHHQAALASNLKPGPSLHLVRETAEKSGKISCYFRFLGHLGHLKKYRLVIKSLNTPYALASLELETNQTGFGCVEVFTNGCINLDLDTETKYNWLAAVLPPSSDLLELEIEPTDQSSIPAHFVVNLVDLDTKQVQGTHNIDFPAGDV